MTKNKYHRSDWIDFIDDQGLYDIFSTLTFAKTITDSYAIKSYNFILHQMNKALFGKRYKRKELFTQGFTFAERQRSGNLHFHSVTKFHPELTGYQRDCYEGIFRSCANKLTITNTMYEHIQITDNNSINVQLYDNNVKLIDYLTKEMKYENKNTADSIAAISINGIDLLDQQLEHLHAADQTHGNVTAFLRQLRL